MAQRDLLNRLADAGEEAISKLAQAPGAERMLGVVGNLRERIDELQKRVMGLDELEQRVRTLDELERRVDALEARLAEPPVLASTAKRRTTRKPTAATRTRRRSAAAAPPDTPRPDTGPASSDPSTAPTGGDSPG